MFKMSLQYEKLMQPLHCLWLVDEDKVCGQQFSSAKAFASHLRSAHVFKCQLPHTVEDGYPKTGLTCGWRGCEQVVLCATVTDYLLHVLAHPYHSFLKLLGKEFQAKHNLPACQYESTYLEVVQPLEVEPQCLWHNGDCGKTFDDVWEFYDHVRSHIRSKESGGICLWKGCKFSGRDRNKVLEHCRTHLHEKVIACPSCGVHFSNNTKLKDHLNRQSNPASSHDKDLSCSFCHKSFPNQRLLRDHARKHVNTIKCPHCELTCQGPSRLIQHIRYRHEVSKAHQCPLCNKHYKTAQSLAVHIETHGGFRVLCDVPGCNYVAKTARNMRAHVNSVHGKPELRKNFSCHICNCCFQVGHELTVHLKRKHGFKLPPGHCRFRYILSEDGYKRLQTVRLDDENVYTPEVSTFTTISEGAAMDTTPVEDGGSDNLSCPEDSDDEELVPSSPQCVTPLKRPEPCPEGNGDTASFTADQCITPRINSPGASSDYSWLPDLSLSPEPQSTNVYSNSPATLPAFSSSSSQPLPSPDPAHSHVLIGSTHVPVKIADAIQMLPDILLDDIKF